MLASVDDNNDGELNAPEFADFLRIVRARAVETSKKALKVVDSNGSGTLTMDEAKQIAFVSDYLKRKFNLKNRIIMVLMKPL